MKTDGVTVDPAKDRYSGWLWVRKLLFLDF